MGSQPAHENYLWGNPAFAGAPILARAFGEEGRHMRPGAVAANDGLPLHVYEQDGERELKPCTEALLTEDAAERFPDRGLTSLLSLKERDVVQLVRFQSISRPSKPLAGPWFRGFTH